MIRKSKQRLMLLVEGDTEENYMKELKNNPDVYFSIKPVNMHGGGYTNFKNRLRKESTKGFLAIFILIDLDKAFDEKKQLKDLIDYCKMQNKKSEIPYILIGTNKDFEFFACCHCPNYKKGNTDQYITKIFGYKDVGKFKSDTKIYTFLNSDHRSFKEALNKLSSKHPAYFKHVYKKEKKGLDITIKLSKTIINQDALTSLHSNIYELFDIIGIS
ncbi:RloB domain-containing protein [Lutibacter sp. B2]|nr:RloB domain-containing protein [Lutibacter sp. B2]